MLKKSKVNYKYFVIGSFLVLASVFFVTYFWKAYVWQVSVSQVLGRVETEFEGQEPMVRPVKGDPLIMSAEEINRMLIRETDPILGSWANLENKLLVIEFGDLTDQKTREFKEDVDKIISVLGEDGIFVWKDFPQPYNEESRNAALAARCAQDQGRFWKYYDLMWQQTEFNQDVYVSLANRAGLDLTKFSLCYEGKEKMDLVGQGIDQAQKYWVEKVPHLFVGGVSIEIDDDYSYEKLERIVGEELIKKMINN